MLLGPLLLSLVLLSICEALPLQDAAGEDSSSGRHPAGQLKDTSNSLHPEYAYDLRFYRRQIPHGERTTALKKLVQTYLVTLNDLGIETWLVHDTLLGWWWGKRVLPWALDVSAQVSEPGIFFLAAYYNMSTFHFKGADIPRERRYLLELSPHARDREQSGGSSAADARWIDTSSGLFMNVYAVRYNLAHPGGEGMLSCKDGSEIKDTYLFPLRKTTFGGVPAKIPYRYKELLVAEYGKEALANPEQDGRRVVRDRMHGMQWLLKEDSTL
ncbi:LicD family-domain-containing protein [Chaetomium strumarium]|uniref:LicD family-domain-containing protein n=1 Tax=Chaetomium strumarium TaxID=1170767 RepID=A0AAJ0M5U4_9PEZI|nr:LicD family-domain-containing protein [Chaetomium strumarium]